MYEFEDFAGEQNKVIHKIILELDGFEARKEQHEPQRTYQVIEGKEIEDGKFILDVFIGRQPVIHHIRQIDDEACNQKLISVGMPEILIKITYIGGQQPYGNGIQPQHHNLLEFHILYK